MSQLHRNIFAQIMAGLEPVVETAVAAFVPAGALVVPLIKAGAAAAETALDDTSAAADPSKVLPVDYVSPLPAAAAQPAPAPAPPAADTTGKTGAATAAAAAPLTALDVIAALMQTLQALSTRV